MSKLIVVTGATGLQSLGVIDAFEKARSLVEGRIEMVAADLDDEDSLIKAFVGANAIFAVTDSCEPFGTGIGPEKSKQIEYDQETYFWSTVPSASKLTNREVEVPHFDAKGAIDECIKTDPTLNAKAIFLWTGFYTSNFGYPPLAPIYSKPAAKRILVLPASLLSYLPSLGSVSNIGVTVIGLLQHQYPETPSGQNYFSGWAEIAGKGKLQVISVPFEQFGELHGMWGTELGLMVKLWEVAGAPKMWGTVGDRCVMIDYRDLEGVKELFYDNLMMSSAENSVEVSKTHEGITTITLNRPHRRNAIDHPTAEKLYYAILEFENDETQKIGILYGDGGTFCAGFDLHEVAKASTSIFQGSDAGDQYKGPRFNVEADRVQGRNAGPIGPSRLQVRKPLISAVAGYAVAGGLELSLIADLRVAEEDAIFGVFCRRFGVPLIDGGTVRLQAIVGLGRALDMILTGRAVTAQEGLQMGLVNRVVGKGEGLAEAVKIARQLLAFPQMCMNVDRASCYYAAYDATSFEDALRNEFRNGESVIMQEGVHGAALFAAGVGRHGSNI
ncbi:hypothetical protein ZTR_09457 [Talaromyces verruculosus]|nr:hypothetical protein ZTR_09457 [Talaromyces verruculosus]